MGARQGVGMESFDAISQLLSVLHPYPFDLLQLSPADTSYIRVTSHLSLPGLRGFSGCKTFSAKTRTFMDEVGGLLTLRVWGTFTCMWWGHSLAIGSSSSSYLVEVNTTETYNKQWVGIDGYVSSFLASQWKHSKACFLQSPRWSPLGMTLNCLLHSLVTLLLTCLATLSSALTKLLGLLPK